MLTQVGCVLGKGGSIVTRVRDNTGAMVRVLEQNKGQRRLETGEEVDEVIEIQGVARSCESALQAVSDLLRQYQVGFAGDSSLIFMHSNCRLLLEHCQFVNVPHSPCTELCIGAEIASSPCVQQLTFVDWYNPSWSFEHAS